jgi:hypothetical protein
MNLGLCGGSQVSDDGSKSLCKMARHEVRESGMRPSSASTRQVGMWKGGWQSGGVRVSDSDVNDLMGLLPKSAVMVSHRPPLWRSLRERRSCRALLWRSYPSPNIEGQFPAMWPLLINWPHVRHRMVGLCERMRVLCTPHMSSCLCVNWTWVSDEWFLER